MTGEDEDTGEEPDSRDPAATADDNGSNPFEDADPAEADRPEDNHPDDTDPLDDLADAASGHEGDPFAGLGEWDGAESMGIGDDGTDGEDMAMPGEFEPVDDPGVGAFDVDEPPESDPFSEMTPEFAELDLGDVDEDEVWEALSAAEARGSVADVENRTYAEVSKHSYCEQCEYLTGPPETACTNEGTEILAFTDMETVRVVDCPVVAERRRLEQEH